MFETDVIVIIRNQFAIFNNDFPYDENNQLSINIKVFVVKLRI